MPYPVQVEPTALVRAARELIEQQGLENVSLAMLAAHFNVKAPSLYRHFSSKTDLLRAVNLDTTRELVHAMQTAGSSAQPPAQRMLNMALAYRAYVHQHPACYRLAYTHASPELRPDEAELLALALPLQAVMAELYSEADSLAALRGVYALVHGFVMLEINHMLQRGGDLEATFIQVVKAYLAGWPNANGALPASG